MAEMLECRVNYFSGDVNEEGLPRLYIGYQVVGGPGSAEGIGLAAITVSAVTNPAVTESCQLFHAVLQGGPAAALAKALRYLDIYHDNQYLHKVQTDVRSYHCQKPPVGKMHATEQTRHSVAVPRIEPMVLRAHLEMGETLTVLDARSTEDWQSATHHIPGDERIDRQSLSTEPRWPKEQLTVVYCTSPRDEAAAEVVAWLRQRGYIRAYVLHGGLEAWLAAEGAVQARG